MTKDINGIKKTTQKIFFDVRCDAKKLLEAPGCRAFMIGGSAFGAAIVAIAIFLSNVVVLASPTLYSSENHFLVNGISFTIMSFFVILLFSPIYCGLYNSALISSNGKAPEIHDIFKFCSTPYLYIRSVKIFLISFWYVCGTLVVIGISSVIVGIAGEYFQSSLETVETFSSNVMYSFIFFGGLFFLFRRRFRFFLVPFAVENTELTIKECLHTAAKIKSPRQGFNFYTDLIKTYAFLILSLFTIGIFYIVYAAPRAVTTKIAYYKAIKID